jgi:glycosyltransferase involved in cell wall biosynthesis
MTDGPEGLLRSPAVGHAGSGAEKAAGHRLLIVGYHSPPGREVGGLRWWGLGGHLARRGWQVHYLSCREGAEAEPVPDGMSVERVPPARTLDDRYRGWRSARREDRVPDGVGPADLSGGAASSAPPASASRVAQHLRALRREAGSLLSFPDEGRGWMGPGRRAIRRAVSGFRPDVVVSTGPPHSVHLATAMGLGRSGSPWVVDFRDPWADEARAHLDAAWAAPVFSRLEASVVGRAHRVFTTTPELAEVLARRYPGARVTWLPNGVDVASLPHRDPGGRRPFTVIHLGTLYHRRDPIPAVDAFARLLRHHPVLEGEGARLLFVGGARAGYRESIEARALELGVEDHVSVLGPRPRDEALRLLASSAVSLVLAQDQATAVPAKIYEAAGMGLPALVITEPWSAAANAGRRLGAAVHEATDVEGMARSLAAARFGEWSGTVPEGTLLDYGVLAGVAEEVLLRTIRGNR